jgi:phosphatidylserine decarboxylase
LAVAPGGLFLLIANFFRDPPRRLTTGNGMYISPADGKVVEISKIAHDEFIGGPAVRIGMYLTILNVHVNRMPIRSRVLRLKYNLGRFMSATNPESALVNENMWMGFEEEDAPHRKYIMRQISGGIARRIVCDIRMGEVLEQGHKFGMIKLGSRAEVIVPDLPGLEIVVPLNKWVKAGRDVLCRFA